MSKGTIQNTDVKKGNVKAGAVKKQNVSAQTKKQQPKAAPQRVKMSKSAKAQNTKAEAKKAKTKAKSQTVAKEQDFGDIVRMPGLVKRTLMVAAYPAMVKNETKDGEVKFVGFLPGFEFCSVEDIASIGECMQLLQDKLDDEVESLILKNEGLPFLPDDETLLKAYPGFEIKMLDINVWALPDDGNDCCGGEHYHHHCGCGCCGHDEE
ncbi:MAG: hypothetical protein LBN07_00160 [Christensenellaceae bacterium]|nr:hypothetical protein [Christensenellaceae bacterium]